MFCTQISETPFTSYDLRDRLTSLKKLGCRPRILNVLGMEFDRDLTVTDILEEFDTIEELFLPSNIDGKIIRGLRKIRGLRTAAVHFEGGAGKNEIRFPSEIERIHILPSCVLDASDLSNFLRESLPRHPSKPITLTLDVLDLGYNWDKLSIPPSVAEILTTKRRNFPKDFTDALRRGGFYRALRTEDMTVFRRPDGHSPRNLEQGPFPEDLDYSLGVAEQVDQALLKIVREFFNA